MAAESGHWDSYAARWGLIGEPLRPGAEDLQYLARCAGPHLSARSASSVLLLGVTPEIAELRWPAGTRLLAVDKSEGMVRAVWPGDTAWRRAVLSDWLSFVPDEPFDLIVGDGVFTLLDYPVGYARLAGALTHWTRPGGLLSVRSFCRPERAESLEQVFGDLSRGGIGSFHAFKWRLAMAVQGEATRGVRLGDIWQAFHDRAGPAHELAARTGWPEPVIANIDSYRDLDDRYSYPTESELIDCLREEFELVETWRGSYELADRCPHHTFRRRA